MRRPQLADVLADAVRAQLATVHTSLPGIVQAYDQATQRATVQLSVQFSRRDPDTGERIPYTPAPLPNVPILWPSGGDYSDTWPLVRGDEVWVLFAERSVDEWLVSDGGRVVTPASVRRFNLSDAVALPVRSAHALPSSAVANARVIRGGDIRLGSAGATDLVALASKVEAEIDALWTALAAHVHSGGVLTGALTGPATPTITPTPSSVGATKVKAE
ncbi:MAG: Gp138 family membrane-puncturing spike protein [Bradymonadaceae bacterium]